MTFSIFRYAALNRLYEDNSDSDDNEVLNIVSEPATSDLVTSNNTFENVSINTEIKNNFEQHDLGPIADDGVEVDVKSEVYDDGVEVDVKSEVYDDGVEVDVDTKIKGGDQIITYDVSFISAFPFIVAKAV